MKILVIPVKTCTAIIAEFVKMVDNYFVVTAAHQHITYIV